MDWASAAFDWNQVRAFLATAEEGSLSAAARALGQTQPTLGRQVAALEEALGVVLFERVGRGLILTPTGEDLLEHVRTMRDAAMRISIAASGQHRGIDGTIRITASDTVAAWVLPPIMVELRALAPRLEIEIVAANDIRDLQRREADIAIRHVRPEEPELIARLVREATAGFYASESYIARKGHPKSVEDLRQHDFIGMGDNARMIQYLDAIDISLELENFKLGSENGLVAWELARAGLGIIPMSPEIAGPVPGMVAVLPGFQPIRFPIWLTTHRELHKSRRIRLVFDLLSSHLSKPFPQP